MKGAFDISNLPVLNAFLKLDLQGLPDRDSIPFERYGEEESKVLHDFYGTGKQDIFQGKMVQPHTLYDTQFSSLLLEFRIALSQEHNGKEKSLKSKFGLVNAHKDKTRKLPRELEDELYIIAKKVNNPLFVEDLLKGTVVGTAFPNI